MFSTRTPTSLQLLREKGMLVAANNLPAFVSLLLAIENADHFPRGRTILYSHRRSARRSADRDQGVSWLPSWGENRISGTVESRPDWVISRQRSWGVPLPVFYSPTGEAILDPKWIRKLADLVAQRGSNVWFELDDAALARELGLPEGTTHRNDTIDVWIDSGREPSGGARDES